MRVLVVGASGQVGRRLVKRLRDRGDEVVGTRFSQDGEAERLDLGDAEAIRALVEKARPEAILNPGGVTAVDWCEEHPDEAMAANATGPGVLAAEAKRTGAYFLHLSSDFVFDGEDGPYFEEDEPNPVSVYGRSKLEGERAVAGENPDAAILRTAVVFSYDPPGKNFLMQVLRAAKEGKGYRAFTDQINSPTLAENLVDAVTQFLEERIGGLYHVAGSQGVSRYDFAQHALNVFRFPASAVTPVASDELRLKARRPKDASLKIGKAQAFLRVRMLWPLQALQRCQEAFLANDEKLR